MAPTPRKIMAGRNGYRSQSPNQLCALCPLHLASADPFCLFLPVTDQQNTLSRHRFVQTTHATCMPSRYCLSAQALQAAGTSLSIRMLPRLPCPPTYDGPPALATSFVNRNSTLLIPFLTILFISSGSTSFVGLTLASTQSFLYYTEQPNH